MAASSSTKLVLNRSLQNHASATPQRMVLVPMVGYPPYPAVGYPPYPAVANGAAMVVIGKPAEMEPIAGAAIIGAAIVVIGIGAAANVSTKGALITGAGMTASIITGAGACTIFSTV